MDNVMSQVSWWKTIGIGRDSDDLKTHAHLKARICNSNKLSGDNSLPELLDWMSIQEKLEISLCFFP